MGKLKAQLIQGCAFFTYINAVNWKDSVYFLPLLIRYLANDNRVQKNRDVVIKKFTIFQDYETREFFV